MAAAAMRNVLGSAAARRTLLIAGAGIGTGAITLRTRDTDLTDRRRSALADGLLRTLQPNRAACEGLSDTVVKAATVAAGGAVLYYGYRKLSEGAAKAAPGASLVEIGVLEDLPEPMLYKEALTAINRGDFETAIKFLKTEADKGYAAAQVKLSEAYFSGTVTPKNNAEGIRYLTAAAHQGHTAALVRLGSAYDTGDLAADGIPEDIPKANQYFQAAYERGSPHAAFLLSWSYKVGEGVEKDVGKAKDLLRFTAQHLPEDDEIRNRAVQMLDIIEKEESA